MSIAVRIVVALFLLLVAACCGFGLLATFEPLDRNTQVFWRMVYVVVGVACLIQVMRLARSKKNGP